ncbi:MAG: metallophosphoesterase [Anaerolineales bacterium]|nr:metallophosphoesterase [Anaerolineales bacterium]
MKIVAISDTHGKHWNLDVPNGDILIHAGDLTTTGILEDVEDFNGFLGEQPHPAKIVVAGNHDFCFEREPEKSAALLTNAIYLQDQAVEIGGIRFYGSPWQPWFFDWAFNLKRGPEIRAKWDLISEGTEVLITHAAPYGCGDRTSRGQHMGCRDLLDVVESIRPRVHIFGHIHEGVGMMVNEHTTFINASICDVRYEIANEPLVHVYET